MTIPTNINPTFDINQSEVDQSGVEQNHASATQHITTRQLHMVRVDGIEHFYWELGPALAMLETDPEAEFELITVH